jgi:hypothetical protein
MYLPVFKTRSYYVASLELVIFLVPVGQVLGLQCVLPCLLKHAFLSGSFTLGFERKAGTVAPGRLLLTRKSTRALLSQTCQFLPESNISGKSSKDTVQIKELKVSRSIADFVYLLA